MFRKTLNCLTEFWIHSFWMCLCCKVRIHSLQHSGHEYSAFTYNFKQVFAFSFHFLGIIMHFQKHLSIFQKYLLMNLNKFVSAWSNIQPTMFILFIKIYSTPLDFGLSNYLNKENLLKTRCGSAQYAAPELFDSGGNYGPSVEIWSL